MSKTATQCAIWGTPAYARSPGDSTFFTSARAGGTYWITKTALSLASQLSKQQKISLTSRVVDANKVGDILSIDSGNILEFSNYPRLDVMERAFRLLDRLVEMTKYIGQIVYFSFSIDGSDDLEIRTDENRTSYSSWTMLANSESDSAEELQYLLKILRDESYIALTFSSTSNFMILPKTYVRIEQIRNKSKSNQVFVAMWFDSSMDKIYSDAIDPAIRECGFIPARVDRIEHVDKIDDRIILEIKRSKLIVADFTSEKGCPRGGVYFEAGYALGLGIPVVWTCRSDIISEIHFDTRQFNHITWSSAEDLKIKLRNRILAII